MESRGDNLIFLCLPSFAPGAANGNSGVIDRLGISAPGNTVMREFGMMADAVKAALG